MGPMPRPFTDQLAPLASRNRGRGGRGRGREGPSPLLRVLSFYDTAERSGESNWPVCRGGFRLKLKFSRSSKDHYLGETISRTVSVFTVLKKKGRKGKERNISIVINYDPPDSRRKGDSDRCRPRKVFLVSRVVRLIAVENQGELKPSGARLA